MQTLGRTVSSAEVPGEIRRPGLQLVLARATLEAAHQVVDEAAGSHLEAARPAGPRALLGRLPPDQRQVLRRRFGLDGPPTTRAELADELGLSESTVRRIEVRGLESLRRSLARLDAA